MHPYLPNIGKQEYIHTVIACQIHKIVVLADTACMLDIGSAVGIIQAAVVGFSLYWLHIDPGRCIIGHIAAHQIGTVLHQVKALGHHIVRKARNHKQCVGILIVIPVFHRDTHEQHRQNQQHKDKQSDQKITKKLFDLHSFPTLSRIYIQYITENYEFPQKKAPAEAGALIPLRAMNYS